MIDLRLGRWQDVLADVECDALIADPPYSDKTHEGWNEGEKQVRTSCGKKTRQSVDYERWTPAHVNEFVCAWHERTRGWMVIFTDDVLMPSFRKAFVQVGRYSFAPVPVIQPRPRMLGDGPASWTVYLLVARPRTKEFARWGCLPGAYDSRCDTKTGIVAGSKPLDLMRCVVRDYSRPGDVVCDPCAGGATTLLAAQMEGRRAIGSEMDKSTFVKAQARCSEMPLPNGKQEVLFGGVE